MKRLSFFVALIGALGLSLLGCQGAPGPFLIIQMCVQDRQGLETLRHELRDIATREGMRYLDGSEATKNSIEMMKSGELRRNDGTPYLNIQLNRGDGVGIGAGNLGLPGYQVALAFNSGNDRREAERISSAVVDRLGQYWQVIPVPEGQGAKPMEGCQ